MNCLENSISTNQFLFNSSVGMAFGAKGHYFGTALQKANVNQVTNTVLSNLIYSLPSNGLSRAYEEKK
jgi:hypothetical protein